MTSWSRDIHGLQRRLRRQDERYGDCSAGEGEEEYSGKSVSCLCLKIQPQLTLYSMRELLEKAHEEDEDELFREEADDVEFEAPRELLL